MSRYTKKVEYLKRLQLVLIITCILGVIIFFLFITRPKVSGYVLKDECGPIGGSISHSINDEDSCSNVCHAYCQSVKRKYYRSTFELKALECNLCNCFCKE